MRIDKELFVSAARVASNEPEGNIGPWSHESESWFVMNDLPKWIRALFERYIPKRELWAGAGALFDERRILKWNSDFPHALRSKLLIVGTAANGDHIAIDLNDGVTGYISHEHEWEVNPRSFFIGVSPSIGRYLSDMNRESSLLPDDYWGATKPD
jgi:hypothetical protein